MGRTEKGIGASDNKQRGLKQYRNSSASILCLCAFVFSGLAFSNTDLVLPTGIETERYSAQPIGIEKIGGYSKFNARFLIWWSGMSKQLPIRNGFDMYRVTYLTHGERGTLVEASGLLSMPRGRHAKSVVSWQHGTSLKREDAPSTPTPDEGVLASVIFAGGGAVLLAPDYIGFGQSTLPHPYYHLPTGVGSTTDLILASRAIFVASGLSFPEGLFLAGFSQGGHCTMAVTRHLEQTPILGISLIASASVAGPLDLDGFAFNNALEGNSESASLYLAYVLNSYARIYGHKLSEVFRAPYADLLPQLFNGETSGQDIMKQLPRHPRQMFLETFLIKYRSGDLGWPGLRLSENDLDGWLPETPLRLYYGRSDLDVSPSEALVQVEKWHQQGVDVNLVNVGDLDHNETVIKAAPLLRDWFNGF